MKSFITDAPAVHTLPVPALVRALLDAAVLAGEVRETHALSVHAASLVVAVVRARLLAAVLSSETLVAHALAIHASAVVVALVRAGGH